MRADGVEATREATDESEMPVGRDSCVKYEADWEYVTRDGSQAHMDRLDSDRGGGGEGE